MDTDSKDSKTENHPSVAGTIAQGTLTLEQRVEAKNTEEKISHPAFPQAMEEAQTKLRSGAAEWHSYDEVFGE